MTHEVVTNEKTQDAWNILEASILEASIIISVTRFSQRLSQFPSQGASALYSAENERTLEIGLRPLQFALQHL